MADPPRKSRKPAGMGEADYRAGARDRLGEAFVLLRAEEFGGSTYLAGRAAEGALRAVLWTHDVDIRRGKKSLDTGHDLRLLLVTVSNLGLLRTGGPAHPLTGEVQFVARLWSNDLRFESSRSIEARWRRMAEFAAGRTYKRAATDFYDACSSIVKTCEALCLSPPPESPLPRSRKS